jgi:peptide/nickel transport system ATP-binding protein
MYLGRMAEIGTTEEIFARPRHPYTQMLLDAIPRLEADGHARKPVAGELPNPLNPPTGCAFHTRCLWAQDRCRRERPDLLPTTTGTLVACHAVQEGRLQIR